MYKVIRKAGFNDLEDDFFRYNYGDIYPRKGLKPTEERIAILSSIDNKLNEILIEEVYPKKQINNQTDKELSKINNTSSDEKETSE